MTPRARGAASATRSRKVPMFAALAPLLIFVGIDGVVHGVARSALHQGKNLHTVSVCLSLSRSHARSLVRVLSLCLSSHSSSDDTRFFVSCSIEPNSLDVSFRFVSPEMKLPERGLAAVCKPPVLVFIFSYVYLSLYLSASFPVSFSCL